MPTARVGWAQVASAHASLKEGGSFCSFSPCVEQVQQTCEALRTGGFHSVRTVEVRFTKYESKIMDLKIPDFGAAKSAAPADGVGDGGEEGAAAAEGSSAASQRTKRPREGEEAAAAEKRPRPASSEAQAVAASSPGAAAAEAADGAAGGAEAASGPVARRQVSMVSSRTLPGMAHSSYLTFAMKITTTERCATPHELLHNRWLARL